MKAGIQLDRKPNSSLAPKQQTGFSLLQLIRMKKVEFSKELQSLEVGEISLPQIQNENHHTYNIKEPQQSKKQLKQQNYNNQKCYNNLLLTPQNNGGNKFKTILDQFYTGQKSRSFQAVSLRSKLMNKNGKNQTNVINITESKANRTKTQTKSRELKKVTESSHNNSIKKPIFPPEDASHQYDQYISIFQQCVQRIPKNMKMRNQENLTDTIIQLQHFNPFFNRNPRIVNVCLLKMGKIVMKSSSTILYRAGQQLDSFFIILQGKVKLVQGAFRRVCQTGETVLEQILFTQKGKKIALQRAKSINKTYLLELKTEEYKKLKQELIRHGLKLGCQQMQTIIKRNFIIKNWMRNKKKIDCYK